MRPQHDDRFTLRGGIGGSGAQRAEVRHNSQLDHPGLEGRKIWLPPRSVCLIVKTSSAPIGADLLRWAVNYLALVMKPQVASEHDLAVCITDFCKISLYQKISVRVLELHDYDALSYTQSRCSKYL